MSLAPGVEASRVVEGLHELGASSLALPAPELPAVIVAEVADRRLRRFLTDAAAIPGVLVAEPDALSYTQARPAAPATRAVPAADRPVRPAEPDLPPGWSSTELE